MPRDDTQFKRGKSGNPKGRPKGARGKITQQAEELLAKLTAGPKAAKSLEKLRDEQPAAFWRLVVSLLPKQAQVEGDHSGNVSFRMIWAGDEDRADKQSTKIKEHGAYPGGPADNPRGLSG